MNVETALQIEELQVLVDDKPADVKTLAGMKVMDLEKCVISLHGSPIFLERGSYANPGNTPLNQQEKLLITAYPLAMGYHWAGYFIGIPQLPCDPFLPSSDALHFLQEVYDGIQLLKTFRVSELVD